MKSFRFHAYDANGRGISGTLAAPSLASLEDLLRDRGLWLNQAREAAVEVGGSTSSLAVPRTDLIHFFVQGAMLLKAGITLPSALERIAADASDRPAGRVVSDLLDQVNAGVALHKAMARHPRVFSGQVVAMSEAGEVSGRLPEVFEGLASHFEWVDQIAGDIRQALIYPAVVLSAAAGLVGVLFTWVVPRFVTLLTDLNLEIPLITRIVMVASDLFTRGWPVWVPALLLVPALGALSSRNPSLAARRDAALMGLPIFGDLFTLFALSRLSHNLAMLCRAGIPLVRSLEICQGLVGNQVMARAIDEVRSRVVEGVALHRALAAHPVFPSLLVALVATGEASGNLDRSLDSLSSYFNRQIPRRMKLVFSVFDPLMMVGLVAVVGVVALAVILPVLQLWQLR
jgi:type II secretory pathway component PulF